MKQTQVIEVVGDQMHSIMRTTDSFDEAAVLYYKNDMSTSHKKRMLKRAFPYKKYGR